MDLVAACRAFVNVSERGSFTVGAAAARMSQSVASRRVAALEKHFGERLFERTSRRATLTPFGRDMLPFARRLLLLADDLEREAETAKRRPLRLAVPGTCSTAGLARLVAVGRENGLPIEPRAASPAQRTELVHAQEVRAALAAVPADEATWTVPLGLAAGRKPRAGRLYVDSLRQSRGDTSPPRRIRLQPEDDVPHVRDPMTRLCAAAGLRPSQLVVEHALTAAAAEVMCSHDLLLCSAEQARELGLHWRPVGETALARGFAVASTAGGDGDRLRTRLGEEIAACLGATGTDGSADADAEAGPDRDAEAGRATAAHAAPERKMTR